VKKLEDIRKELHRYPELSGEERQTSLRIKQYLSAYKPDSIFEGLGGFGVLAVFEGKEAGPVVMFRVEMDALHVYEKSNLPYVSKTAGVAHTCGHDGHMTMMLSFVQKIADKRPQKGKVMVLFQPAEETGEGALRVLKSDIFKHSIPDYVFSIHNIPGVELGTTILKSGSMCAASVGLQLDLQGRYSHAAEPEKGINPVYCFPSMIKEFREITDSGDFKDMVNLTFTHVQLGEYAFGISPGKAQMLCTLRAYQNEDMERLKVLIVEKAKEIADRYNLFVKESWHESFNAVVNNQEAVEIAANAAKAINLPIVEIKEPYKWSEDFAEYLLKYKGAFIGIGSGIDTPDLHNEYYDFPDELIEVGGAMFYSLYEQVMNGT